MNRLLTAGALLLCLAAGGCVQRRLVCFQYTASHPPPEPAVDARGFPLRRTELVDCRWEKQIDLRSEPQGARIMVNGYYVGETPMRVRIPCSSAGRFLRTTKLRLLPGDGGGVVRSAIYPEGTRIPSRLDFDARLVAPGR